ncbi:hypothetical protein AAC387_Pa01g0397 [Persea americana]
MCLTNKVAHENLRIDVQAPNLEVLSVYSKHLGKYYFKDTLSLREAYINVWRPQGGISVYSKHLGKYYFKDTLSLREAYINVWRSQGGISGVIECLYSLETSLQNLCHVRVLKLSTDCIQFLKALSLRALQNLPPLIFKHKHLILETGPTKWELPGIVYLLKNSPDLETLSVKIEESILCYDRSMVLGEEFKFDETEYWESFISPFSYVVHYLKTIKIWDAASELYLALRITSEASSRNQENGVRFLKYFLKSAIRLEKLTYITKPNFKGIHDIAQMISALPVATSSAEILVCL